MYCNRKEYAMEYTSCIKDELGTIVRWCNEYSEEENEQYLLDHPEYRRCCEPIEDDRDY